MTDNPGMFLLTSRQETWYIHKGYQRNIEAVAEAYKTRNLVGCVIVQASGHHLRLVGYNTYGLTIHSGKRGNGILSPVLQYFIIFPVIHQGFYDVVHIVSHVGFIRNNMVQCRIGTCRIITGIHYRSIFHIVSREERKKIAYLTNAVFIIFRGKLGNAGNAVMGHGATEVFRTDLFSGYGFNYLRSGEEHLAGSLNHVNKIHQ